MAVQLNHTIVRCSDKEASAAFLADILGLGEPTTFGPFRVVTMGNDVELDYMEADDVLSQHYAFIVTEDEFDQIRDRIVERGLTYFADPGGTEADQINTNDGGRGLYWSDPNGHWLEVITVPYGGGESG